MVLFRSCKWQTCTSPSDRLAKYCDQHICMFVCLYARIFQNHTSEFHQIFCACYLWAGCGSVLLRRQCSRLCTSSIVDVVMFSRSGASGPESKMTRMFRRVHQVIAPPDAKPAKFRSTISGSVTFSAVDGVC